MNWKRNRTNGESKSSEKPWSPSKDSFIAGTEITPVASKFRRPWEAQIARLTEEVDNLSDELDAARERIEELHGQNYTAQDAMWRYREACVMALAALQMLNKDKVADGTIAHVWGIVFPDEPVPKSPEKSYSSSSSSSYKPSSSSSSSHSSSSSEEQRKKNEELKAKLKAKQEGKS